LVARSFFWPEVDILSKMAVCLVVRKESKMGLLDKLNKAKSATGSTGGGKKRSFSSTTGLWVQLEDGDNKVRLGGNVAVCERHYVKDLVSAEAMRPKGESRADVSANVTCMNWDTDNQGKSEEEVHCCPICDLRSASNIKLKEAKESGDEDSEKKMKELSGKSFARSRYSWDAISRKDPLVKTKDGDGNETEEMAWKILGLGTEGTEAIEALCKQYPQLADEDEGCDIVISKHQGTRTTYGASFALDGPNIAVTPLTDEEKEMKDLNLVRYIASHMSPRTLFQSLKPSYQELITDVLGKTAGDYPEDCPVQKTMQNDDGEKKTESTPNPASAPKKAASGAPKRKAASVADEFDDVPETKEEAKPEAKNETFSEETEKPTPPKAPSKPAPPKAPSKPAAPSKPKAPAPKEEAPEAAEAPAEEEAVADGNPSCFGYCDSDDDECKKCDQMADCQANPQE
jgi:hypothetical protein